MAVSSEIQVSLLIIWAVVLGRHIVNCSEGSLCTTTSQDGPRAAQVCKALITFVQMYAKATNQRVPTNQELVRENPELLDIGMRRKDVGHWQMFIG